MRATILFLFTAICLFANAQKKLALIVAIGNYLPTSNIPPISSLNDVKYIKAVLANNGFRQQDIDSLQDSKATKLAILAALDRLAKKAGRGDIVLVHFSCHGQQIRDQKTVAEGKDEEDGYDEALVPYDVKKPQYYPGVYKGENHLRDDDLGPKLIAIRNKLGRNGSLLVLLDACFSGTATRAIEFTQSRGEPIPFNDPENPISENIDLAEEDHFFDGLADSAANMVVISGSGPHQQNFQTEVATNGTKEQVGSLTYAFYKAMNDLPSQSDYELLFQKIKATIQAHHPEQIPMIEGNVSQIVFSGNFQPKKETIYLTALPGQGNSGDSMFTINKGVMDGVAEGSIVQILQPGNSVAIGKGVIQRSDRFIAYGISDKPLTAGSAYEARLSELSYGRLALSLKIKAVNADLHAAGIKAQVARWLKHFSFISLSDTAEMMLDISRGDHGLIASLVDEIDSTRWLAALNSDSLSERDLKDLLAAMKNYMRIKYLRLMEDGGELLKDIAASIIPANTGSNIRNLVLQTGEDYSLQLINKSGEKLFYTVLDLTPDNKIAILYPSAGRQPAEYLIEKNAIINRKLRVSRGTPTGQEFLKIIFSKEPMDLRSVFEHTVTRAEMHSFQSVLDDLLSDEDSPRATRGEIGNIHPEEVGILTLSFAVK